MGFLCDLVIVLLKKKVILTLAKTVRKTFFRTIATGGQLYRNGDRESKLNSEYRKDEWSFAANEQSEGVCG